MTTKIAFLLDILKDIYVLYNNKKFYESRNSLWITIPRLFIAKNDLYYTSICAILQCSPVATGLFYKKIAKYVIK